MQLANTITLLFHGALTFVQDRTHKINSLVSKI